jgi:hypothetical protein
MECIMTTLRRLTLVAAVAVALCSARADAQTLETAPAAAQQVLSTNPFGDLLSWLNAEYERTVDEETTWGVSASRLESDYASASIFVRWYPAHTVFDGFYLGAHAGVYQFQEYGRRGDTVPGAGLHIGRAWLVGATRRTSLSLGFGVTRRIGSTSGAAPDAWPSVRLINVGVVF